MNGAGQSAKKVAAQWGALRESPFVAWLRRAFASRRDRGIVISGRRNGDASPSRLELLEQLGVIVESSDDAIVGISLQGMVTSWNGGAKRLYGYSAEEMIGRSINLLVPPDRPHELDGILERLGSGERIEHYETVRRRKDGRPVDVAVQISPVFGDGGRIVAASAIVRDISERKRAEQEIAHLASFPQLNPNPILETSLEGKISYANPAMLAIDPEILSRAGESPMLVEWPLVAARFHGGAGTITREVQANGRLYHQTIHSLPEQGLLRWYLVDITELRQAQQALIRSEKLASVGRMAATIAHEVNNPLAAAINALYLIRTDPELPEHILGNVRLAEQELASISHMSSQAIGLSSKLGPPGAVDVAATVKSVVEIYGPKLRNKNIAVKTRFRSKAAARAVEGELRQVVSSVIANSIDALPQNGRLEIRVCGPQALPGNRRMVRLTIADNGEGIAPENQKLIFEPFFTTKQVVGTGLGLWVTSELVKKNKGWLRVKSRRGKGTVVSVWLPMERRGQERRSV